MRIRAFRELALAALVTGFMVCPAQAGLVLDNWDEYFLLNLNAIGTAQSSSQIIAEADAAFFGQVSRIVTIDQFTSGTTHAEVVSNTLVFTTTQGTGQMILDYSFTKGVQFEPLYSLEIQIENNLDSPYNVDVYWKDQSQLSHFATTLTVPEFFPLQEYYVNIDSQNNPIYGLQFVYNGDHSGPRQMDIDARLCGFEAVPEPSTIVGGLVCALLLGGSEWRRRSTQAAA